MGSDSGAGPPRRWPTEARADPGAGPSPWWAPTRLAPVWGQVAARLERGGLEPRGRIRVTGLDREARHALGGLLGRTVVADHATVDLAALDRRLLRRSGVGLVAAAETVLGRSLTDRSAVRAARRQRREAPYAAARDWLADHGELEAAWVEPWLSGLRQDGLLTRDAEPTRLLLLALEVLRACLGAQGLSLARTELAAATAHDAHALDDDRRLSQVVLRALAQRQHRPAPASAHERREVWEAAGVTTDSVSATCLVLGLLALDDHGPGARLRVASAEGDPVHLTHRDLRCGLDLAPGQEVLVCENPRVLEAVAESGRRDLAVVCTSGRPSLVAQEVLRRLGETGARMRYHGDFDWPGVAMANQLLASSAVRPWRMSAEDYQTAPATLPLVGPSVEPTWDDELGPAMRQRGMAVHEEAVLQRLLAEL